jgi:hypothetical protein
MPKFFNEGWERNQKSLDADGVPLGQFGAWDFAILSPRSAFRIPLDT